MTTKTVALLDKQMDFYESEGRFVAFVGGLGSGKTEYCGCMFVVKMVLTQPEHVAGFIGAQSYKQLERVIKPPLFKMLRDFGIKFEWQEAKQILIANGRRVLFGTMDKEGIENAVLGVQLGWFWVDEAARSPEHSIEILEGRLRHPDANGLYGRYTSTPYGFNWFYDAFAGPKKTKYNSMIHMTTYENPYLPEDYIDRLKAKYSKKKFEQEVLAKFVSLEGGHVYDCFEEKHIVEFDHRSIDSAIYQGFDQNVGNMASVFVKYQNETFYVFDELWMANSNTIGVAAEVKSRYPNQRDLFVIPDSTFSHRSANSNQTSKEILRREGFQILPTKNPYVTDRQQCLNAYFHNSGSDRLKIVVHPRCKRLIKELKTLTLEQKEGDVAHLSPALGYVIWKLEPLRKQRPTPRIIQR